MTPLLDQLLVAAIVLAALCYLGLPLVFTRSNRCSGGCQCPAANLKAAAKSASNPKPCL